MSANHQNAYMLLYRLVDGVSHSLSLNDIPEEVLTEVREQVQKVETQTMAET